jgi:hypothetical protein
MITTEEVINSIPKTYKLLDTLVVFETRMALIHRIQEEILKVYDLDFVEVCEILNREEQRAIREYRGAD